MVSDMTYPATVQITTPDRVANWRPLVQWILAIPHYVVMAVLAIVGAVVGTVGWLAVLLTGKLPAGVAGYQAMTIRYNTRVSAYAWFLTTEYPPFDFSMSPVDPGGSATSVNISPALEGKNRLVALFRFIVPISVVSNMANQSNGIEVSGWVWLVALVLAAALIPAYVYAVVIGIVGVVCVFLAFFAVLFTGRWPAGLRRLVTAPMRVGVRFSAYGLLLTDEYPPFSID